MARNVQGGPILPVWVMGQDGTLNLAGVISVSNFPAIQAVSIDALPVGHNIIDSGTLTTVTTVSTVSAATLTAGELHLGQVGGTTVQLSPAISTTNTPYTANDVVGGVITLTNAVRVSGGTGILQSILVKDTTNQKAALTILLFNANPATGTYTDNAAITLNAADEIFNIRKINIAASDYETVGTTAIADLPVIGKVVQATSGTSLYALIVTTGTPTYGTNNTSLYVNFGILQD